MILSGNKIGKMIKSARESKKLTQEELAKKVNKKRSYISRLENDGDNINLKTLIEIVEGGLEGQVKVILKIE